MDCIQDLSAFQGVILSADNLYSFAKLKSKGGNEEKVKYVIEKLFNFLKEKNYITDDGVSREKYEEYQKLALYLVLNADLPVLEEMTEMDGMEAVIWMLPTIPSYLLSELFWNLHMQQFLYQIIAFCNPELGLQVADAFIANMKYLDPVTQLERVPLVAGALYRLLCRLHFARAAPAAAARRSLRACLAHLAAPRRADLVLALPRRRQYQHVGRSLALLLRLLEDCLAHYAAVQPFRADGFADIYLSTHQPESITTETLDFKICDSPDSGILECLQECNTILLDDCATQVMSVSVDIFCAWSEYEENGRSMQQSIGESCYRMRSILRSIPGVADHALVAMLKQISRKPVNVEDIIGDTAAESIAERIDARDADSAAWLAALLRRPGLCGRADLLRLLPARLPALHEDQAAELFDTIALHLRDDNSNEEQLKVLAIKAFQRCSDVVKEKIVDDQFKEYFHDDLQCVEFEDMLTDIFNRLTGAAGAGAGAAYADVLPVFLQNPKRTLVKMIRAAAESAQQADIMLQIIDRLARHRELYYRRDTEPGLVKAAGLALGAADALATDARRDGLLRALDALRRRGALRGHRLLVQVAMPRLHAALRAQDARGLAAAARLLRALPAAHLAKPRAALLAAAAQALDAARRRPADFTPDAPDAIDQLILLKDQLLDTYEGAIPDEELRWLRDKLARATPLTRAHFPQLAPAAPALAALAAHNGVIVLTLSLLEWDSLLPRGERAPAALHAAGAALLQALRAERLRRTPAGRACLQHAHAALATAVQNNYFSQPPTDEQVLAVVGQLEALAGAAGAAGAGALAAGWLPLLARVAAARPELCAALRLRLAAAPALARPFTRAPPD